MITNKNTSKAVQELNVAHTPLHKPQAGISKCALLPLWLTAAGHARGGIFHPCITPTPLSQSCGHIQNLSQTSGFPSSLFDKSCYFAGLFLLICIFPLHQLQEVPTCFLTQLSRQCHVAPTPHRPFLCFLPLCWEALHLAARSLPEGAAGPAGHSAAVSYLETIAR